MHSTASKALAGITLALSLTIPTVTAAPTAQAATRPSGIHLHVSSNLLAFRASTTGAYRFRVIAHHPTGKPSAGKARIYVDGRHLQTRTLRDGRALFRVDRSRLPDNRPARIKVRVIPWNTDLRHRIVTRTVKDRRPVVSSGQRIVAAARSQVGDRYVYGASGPHAWDCSGVTAYAYRVGAGKILPHQSAAQASMGRRVSEPRLGDLVYVPGHIAIYSGAGRVIEAATPATGVVERRIWQKGAVYIRP